MIVTGTVRENILFGREFNKQRYELVVNACCLVQDFMSMPSGDGTKVGEMGNTLSGGQRSRISLARALYRQDNTIILVD